MSSGTIVLPPTCQSSQAFGPGCFPCPNGVLTQPGVQNLQVYTPFGSITNATGTFTANKVVYNYATLNQCPLGGINSGGLSLMFAVCGGPVQCSLVMIPQSRSQSVSDTLAQLYANQTTTDVIRINVGDPTTPLPAPGCIKSISWGGEGVTPQSGQAQTMPNYCSKNMSTGWAFNDGWGEACIAAIEANVTPFHTTYCQLQLFPKTQGQNQATRRRLGREFERHGFRDSSQMALQANIIMQGQPFSGAISTSGTYTIFQTVLGTPSEIVPSTTQLSTTTPMIPVLVWTQSCPLLPTTIFLATSSGQLCESFECFDIKKTTLPPVSVVSTLQPPALTSKWPVQSYRTTALWVGVPLDPTTSLLPSPQFTTIDNAACYGLNIILTTNGANYSDGQVTFCGCPPYGSSSSNVDQNMLRVIMGGAPLPLGGSIPVGKINAPNLLSITTSDEAISTALQDGCMDTPVNAPCYIDWSQSIIQYFNTTQGKMPNYMTLDVSIVEEQLGQSVRAWAIIKAIPFVTPDNQYSFGQKTPKQLPQTDPQGSNTTAQSELMPFVTPTNITPLAPGMLSAPMPTVVLALENSPLIANAQRNVVVSTSNGSPTQYVFANSAAGVPGSETATPVWATPKLVAQTPVNGLLQTKSYLYCKFNFGSKQPQNTSLVFQTVPLAQAGPLVPMLRVIINGPSQSQNNFTCSLSDGVDAWTTVASGPNLSQYSINNVSFSSASCLLLEFNPDSVVAYLWMYVFESGDKSNLLPSSSGPTAILRLPLNPLAVCRPNNNLYMFSQSPSGFESIAVPSGESAPFASYQDLSTLGSLTSFPCPPNLVDPSVQFNVCRANVQSQSNYLVDAKLDALDVVGIFSGGASAEVRSVFEGRPAQETRRDVGEAFDGLTMLAKEARERSLKPEAYLSERTKWGESVDWSATVNQGVCPNGAQICAPGQQSMAGFNYNYNAIGTQCPLNTTFDPNVLSCLAQHKTCGTGSGQYPNCVGTPSVITTPAGACTNQLDCTVWLNTAPGISRSCLRATQTAATLPGGGPQSLGPLMPGFSPDPASCALPGQPGCPSFGSSTQLCQTAQGSDGNALYTNQCYSGNPSGCDASGGSGCPFPTNVEYDSAQPCLDPDAKNPQPSYCTSAVETPTQSAVQSYGLFPFGQMPCQSYMRGVGTSSFAGKDPVSNQITCPNATADEASWYQTVFGCQPVQALPGLLLNQFGETVVPPPFSSDLVGGSNGQSLSQGWGSSQPDGSTNLYTYGATVNSGQIYPQACLDPAQLGNISSFDATTKIPPVMNVQMSYCVDGDSNGSCQNTIAQFTVENGVYVPRAPAALASGKTSDIVVCGMLEPQAWTAQYASDAGSRTSPAAPDVKSMTTLGLPVDWPQFALANAFTSQASQQYSVTGRNSSSQAKAVQLFMNGSPTLPNTKYNLIVPNDNNVVSVLKPFISAPLGSSPVDAGAYIAENLGFAPWSTFQ